MSAFALDLAGEGLLGDGLLALDLARQIILEACREAQHRFGRNVRARLDQFRRATPADFDAAEEIGLGARHAEEARRLPMRAGAEDLRVRLEAHLRAALVLHLAELLQRPERNAAREFLAVVTLVDRDIHLQLLGERVDDRDADAVQSAGGLIGAGVELAARVQHGHHDLERRLVLHLGMHADGNAAPIVRDGEPAVRLHGHGDEGGVARDGLVHRIVEHLGEEVMHRRFVRPADIHARTPTHRLEPFEHLDRVGVIVRGVRTSQACRPRPCAAQRQRDRRFRSWRRSLARILRRFCAAAKNAAGSARFAIPFFQNAFYIGVIRAKAAGSPFVLRGLRQARYRRDHPASQARKRERHRRSWRRAPNDLGDRSRMTPQRDARRPDWRIEARPAFLDAPRRGRSAFLLLCRLRLGGPTRRRSPLAELAPDVEIYGATLTLGLALFSVFLALVFIAERKRWRRREANLVANLEETRSQRDRAELFLSVDQQVFLAWDGPVGEPDIEGVPATPHRSLLRAGHPGFRLLARARRRRGARERRRKAAPARRSLSPVARRRLRPPLRRRRPRGWRARHAAPARSFGRAAGARSPARALRRDRSL